MDAVLVFLDRPGASAGAILVSAFVALAVAVATNLLNRRTTRQRETIALLNHILWDNDYLIAKDAFVAKRDGIGGLESCIGDPTSSDARAVAKIMNQYELLSIGMNTGILCKKVYSKFYKTRFVRDWEASRAYVQSIRRVQSNDKIFMQFEILAGAWKDKP